jgi:PHP family Zn ribbon phosphoesterase
MGKGFSDWMREQTLAKRKEPDPECMLPDGVWLRDGKPVATCRGCERTYEVEDASTFGNDVSYCGGSPHCIP